MSKAQKIILTISVVLYVPLITLFLGFYSWYPHSAYELAQRNGCRKINKSNNMCILTNKISGKTLEVKPQDLQTYGFVSETLYITEKQIEIMLFATTIFFIILFTLLFLIWRNKK